MCNLGHPPLSSGHDSKCRSEKDDGFVRVTFKTERGKQHSHLKPESIDLKQHDVLSCLPVMGNKMFNLI